MKSEETNKDKTIHISESLQWEIKLQAIQEHITLTELAEVILKQGLAMRQKLNDPPKRAGAAG